MFIRIEHLKRCKPQYVIRLAKFLGIETLGRMFEDIIPEVFNKINAHKLEIQAWKW